MSEDMWILIIAVVWWGIPFLFLAIYSRFEPLPKDFFDGDTMIWISLWPVFLVGAIGFFVLIVPIYYIVRFIGKILFKFEK